MRSFHQTMTLALVLFAVAMSALVSDRVFERLPHLEDEVAYLFQAKTYAGGQLVVETPEPRRAYWQPFVVDYAPSGNRFSKYTPGWPLILMLGVFGGQPWVINAFLSGLVVALAYRLGREIFDPDVGLTAAALTAFSPMALLLNGTLMGHTAALLGVTLFMFAYWRMEKWRYPLRWGLVAGLALGWVIITRPLTAIGISLPFIMWSVIRIIKVFAMFIATDHHQNSATQHNDTSALPHPRLTQFGSPSPFVERGLGGEVWLVVKPYLALTAAAVFISLAIPIYNTAATGSPTQNLYTLVWSYDRVGFGECCGRNGHTLEKGIRHVRFDLSLMAADLYGWQWQDVSDLGQHLAQWLKTGEIGTSITPQLQEHLRTEGDTWPLTGISWVLLPFGIALGFRRHWTWLLAGVALSLIAVHLAYWIGSQRYSTRYYFEALTALSIISALPLARLMRRVGRLPVYALLAVVLIYSLYVYSTPRIMALHGFNLISREILEGVEARRTGDEPVLVIITGGDVRWRALGELMTVTSPYLDSDIVMAWDNLQPGVREAIVARFPERPIIEMQAEGNDAWFTD